MLMSSASAIWTAASSVRFDLLSTFVLGYVIVLATPGPNLLAIGSIASLRGLRAAVPVCVGIAFGAGALGTALLITIEAAAGVVPHGGAVGRLAAVLLLLGAAALVARPPPPAAPGGGDTAAPGRFGAVAGRAAAFGAGFCVAATNPLTGAFFAAQFVGPLGAPPDGVTARVALFGIVITALLFMLTAAAILSYSAARCAALAWRGSVRTVVAVALLATAGATLWPLIWP
jgi:threonine/homoserine/homoserine lactone efflux protein